MKSLINTDLEYYQKAVFSEFLGEIFLGIVFICVLGVLAGFFIFQNPNMSTVFILAWFVACATAGLGRVPKFLSVRVVQGKFWNKRIQNRIHKDIDFVNNILRQALEAKRSLHSINQVVRNNIQAHALLSRRREIETLRAAADNLQNYSFVFRKMRFVDQSLLAVVLKGQKGNNFSSEDWIIFYDNLSAVSISFPSYIEAYGNAIEKAERYLNALESLSAELCSREEVVA